MSEELAWAAGFYDGEGSCSGSPTRLAVRITQVVREPLDRFREATGLGRVTGPYARNGRNQQRQYAYQVCAVPDVQTLFALLRPYLCRPKVDQFERAIASRLTTYGPRAQRTHCRHGHEYTEANTLWSRDTKGRPFRSCRTCHRDQQRRHASLALAK